MTSRLDHIKSTGAAIIWISPCFKSPQVSAMSRQQIFIPRRCLTKLTGLFVRCLKVDMGSVKLTVHSSRARPKSCLV